MTRISKQEVEQLSAFMEKNRSLDPHSANKARMYLGELVRQDLIDKPLADKTSRFVDACRGVSSGRLLWKDLDEAMRGWW